MAEAVSKQRSLEQKRANHAYEAVTKAKGGKGEGVEKPCSQCPRQHSKCWFWDRH